jgi:hypothetical protein
MIVSFEIKDRHGISIELDQPVALRVHRCSSSHSTWCKRTNANHFNYFWIRGEFKAYAGSRAYQPFSVSFVPDRASIKALEAPMGKEQDDQNVDYYNIEITDPNNLDSINVPPSGTFTEAQS